MELWQVILEDNVEANWDDVIDAPLEHIGLALQSLFQALIDEDDLGIKRGLLYDIATAAIIAAQGTYSNEEE